MKWIPLNPQIPLSGCRCHRNGRGSVGILYTFSPRPQVSERNVMKLLDLWNLAPFLLIFTHNQAEMVMP